MKMQSEILKNANKINFNFVIAGILTSVLALGFVLAIIKNPLSAIILITAFALLIIFTLRTDFGIYLIVLSLITGQLLRIPITEGSAIQLTDILVVALSSVWIIKKIILNEKIKSTFIGPFLFIFLSIALLSFVNGLRFLNLDQAMISFFYLLRLWAYATLFFIATDIFKQEKNIYTFKKILFFAFFAIAVAGIIQIIIFPSLMKWAALYGWDPHMYRLFSTFLDPNFVGAFLVIGLMIALGFLFYTKSIEGKLVLIVLAIVFLVSIILTYSRSTYLFLAISFLTFSILRSRKLLLLGIAVIIILLLIFPKSVERIEGGFNIDESARSRFKTWEKTITIIKDHPVLGVGFNAFRYAQDRYSFLEEAAQDHSGAGSDSSILFIFATTGFFGFIAYIIFYILSLIKTKKVFSYSSSLQRRALALALFSILIGLAFHSVFVNSLFYPAIMVPLFIMLGIISTKSA
ncbi:MAG: O-antigen ligase family protein [Candidatus Berkelbacteria bacterium]|nr:O-antigen ligase family protein [Candidatus Berkelbacteria bacterium]